MINLIYDFFLGVLQVWLKLEYFGDWQLEIYWEIEKKSIYLCVAVGRFARNVGGSVVYVLHRMTPNKCIDINWEKCTINTHTYTPQWSKSIIRRWQPILISQVFRKFWALSSFLKDRKSPFFSFELYRHLENHCRWNWWIYLLFLGNFAIF